MINLPTFAVFGVIFATGCVLGMLAEHKVEDVSPSDYVLTVLFSGLDAAMYTLMLVIVQSLLEK